MRIESGFLQQITDDSPSACLRTDNENVRNGNILALFAICIRTNNEVSLQSLSELSVLSGLILDVASR